MLEVPIVVIVSGEGGSGGALGHRDRRPRADAGVRGLQRDSARRAAPPSCGATRTARSRRPRRSRSRRPTCWRSGSSTRSCPSRPAARTTTTTRAAAPGRSGARAGARRAVARCSVGRSGSTRRYEKFRQHGPARAGDFADDGVADARAEPCRMTRLVWEHLPCDDDGAARARRRARRAIRPSPACCACAGSATPDAAARFLQPVARPPARPVAADGHGPGRRRGSSGRWRRRADRGPRRLRRRRHHLDRHPAARARDARRRTSSTSSPSGCGTATGCSRPAIERLHADGVDAHRVGRLRHPRERRGPARARARRRPHHHRPSRARRARCRTRSPSSTPSATTARYPDKHLAGVGVALKLVQALCARAGREQWLPALRQDRGARHARRRRAARRREPRHREARPRVAVARAAHGRPARAARGVGPDRQDDRQLSRRVHPRAAHQRRRADEHARTSRRGSCSRPTRRMGDEARGAGAAAERREPAAPGGGGRSRRPGEEGDRDRPGGRRAQRPRRRRRGLAPRRHRHRRVQARRRVPQAGHRAVGRRRRGPRLVPQHPRLRHARRRSSAAPTSSSASAATSRPPA